MGTNFVGILLSGNGILEAVPASDPARLESAVADHPFIDGNERTGANAAATFLIINDWEPALEEDELVKIVLAVASGQLGKAELVQNFESRCRQPIQPPE